MINSRGESLDCVGNTKRMLLAARILVDRGFDEESSIFCVTGSCQSRVYREWSGFGQSLRATPV